MYRGPKQEVHRSEYYKNEWINLSGWGSVNRRVPFFIACHPSITPQRFCKNKKWKQPWSDPLVGTSLIYIVVFQSHDRNLNWNACPTVEVREHFYFCSPYGVPRQAPPAPGSKLKILDCYSGLLHRVSGKLCMQSYRQLSPIMEGVLSGEIDKCFIIMHSV